VGRRFSDFGVVFDRADGFFAVFFNVLVGSEDVLFSSSAVAKEKAVRMIARRE